MIVFIIPILFPLVLSVFYRKTTYLSLTAKQNKIRKYLWTSIALMPMFLLIGFRASNIGPDTNTYNLMFEKMIDYKFVDIFNNDSIEIGYKIFEWIISRFTNSSHSFQLIYTTVYYICTVIFINQFEDNNFLLCFLFATLGIYKFLFTAVRQCLAISLIMLAYLPLRKKKNISFVVLVLIASLFHKSAIIFLLAYFIFKIKFSKFSICFFIILAILCCLITKPATPLISSLFGYDYGLENTQNGILRFATYLVIILIFIFYGTNIGFSRDENGLFNISVIVLIFWMMRLITRVAERPSYYFLPYLVGLLSQIAPKFFKNSKKENIIFTMIICLCTLFIFMYNINDSNYLPYKFFFF